MKILHIISSANPEHGGPIQGIRNFQHGMRLHPDVQITLLTFERSEDLIKWDFPETLEVIGLGAAKGSWQYNKFLVHWLEENIYHYRHIVVNGIWSYHSHAVMKVLRVLLKRNDGRPLPKVYVMPHGMLDPWFQKDKSRRLKAIRNYFYWHLIEKKVVNQADGILFTCQQELLLARTTFAGYCPKDEYNIGYGITPPPKFKQELLADFYEKTNLNKLGNYLLFLSRVHPKKGVDILLQAYEKLLGTATAPEHLPDLLIAGSGMASDYGRKLSSYVQERPVLAKRVKFLGHLSGNAKWGAIYGCDAFILPSHQENFGIAVAEALACAKPVLITDQVNIYREIQNGGGGIVKTDDLNGTLESLSEWLALTPAEKKQMAVKAQKVYENHFTVDIAASNYLDVMNS